MSIWNDVARDAASAGRAAERLEHAAGRLDDLTRARENLADHARVGWEGAGRDGFERRLANLVTRSEELARHLRGAAATIEAELDDAVREQRRREERRAEIEEHPALSAPAG